MNHTFENYGTFALRVSAGLMMCTHGYAKIFVRSMDDFAAGVAEMGFPAPLVFAWAAALSELVGGICLALGLGTRISAFLIASTMIVAVLIRQAAEPFQKRELGLLYLAVMIYFLFAGGGRWSVDALIKNRGI